MSDTKLLLSTAPLAASETNVTLDIFSEENLLRGDSPRKMLEGKLTFNPQGRIFFIPPQERPASQPIQILSSQKSTSKL